MIGTSVKNRRKCFARYYLKRFAAHKKLLPRNFEASPGKAYHAIY